MSSPDGIWIDRDAAGFGWFVDPTPATNEEFSKHSAGALVAAPGSPAYGKMDLLTIVVHEFGRALGLQESVDARGVMATNFQAGVRVLPGAKDLGAHFGSSVDALPPPMVTDPSVAAILTELSRHVATAGPLQSLASNTIRADSPTAGQEIAQSLLHSEKMSPASARALSQIFTEFDGLPLWDSLVVQLLMGRNS
jgi:hypothetical protein